MKVKVNIIHTRCILRSEAVTASDLRMHHVPCLMMMTSIDSEESFARDRHTHTASSMLTFSKS